jgi:aromatic ring-opening dioxygenase catalytic subunit (LigB family)
MAELVGCFAASHGPMIARTWDTMKPDVKERIERGFNEVGRRLKASRPDVLVMASPDHWCNFFLNNLPSFCIGIGDEHERSSEPFLEKVFSQKVLKGHAELGRHILNTAVSRDFDPSFSQKLELDHGFCLPLWRMGIDPIPAIVPITVNEIEGPLPTMRRCLQWGRVIREAIESFPANLRVAFFASGGLSHFIGEPGMGSVDEKFDHTCISLFENGDDSKLSSTLEEAVRHTGNGGHEVRNWVIAHSMAGSRGFDLIGYEPLTEVYVGCAFAEWKLREQQKAAA